MNKIDIVNKLNTLADYKSQKDVLDLEKQNIIDSILTKEIKEQLANVDVEFAGKAEAVVENISTLEAEIKKDVLELGESVKGNFLHAVWAKGRVSWDTKFLDGYVVSHPELQSARKEGEPSVSMRNAK